MLAMLRRAVAVTVLVAGMLFGVAPASVQAQPVAVVQTVQYYGPGPGYYRGPPPRYYGRPRYGRPFYGPRPGYFGPRPGFRGPRFYGPRGGRGYR